ncbi:MAG: hypothetical protein V3V00_12410 [Saprospiraceae bacterium]
MKNQLLVSLSLLLSISLFSQKQYKVAGTWRYGPTGTIKTLTKTDNGLKSIIDGDDKIDLFQYIGSNKYEANAKAGLFLEFKSDELHLSYNVNTGMQNTWVRYAYTQKKIQPVRDIGTKAVSRRNNNIGTTGGRPFKTAVGLRLGVPLSITYKSFLNKTGALEVFAGYRNFGVGNFISFGVGYQIHKDIPAIDNLQWYYGAGVSGYSWSYEFLDNALSVAPTGFLGWSYTLKKAPINIGADWQPTFFIGNSGFYSGFGAGYGSFYVRYILG